MFQDFIEQERAKRAKLTIEKRPIKYGAVKEHGSQKISLCLGAKAEKDIQQCEAAARSHEECAKENRSH